MATAAIYSNYKHFGAVLLRHGRWLIWFRTASLTEHNTFLVGHLRSLTVIKQTPSQWWSCQWTICGWETKPTWIKLLVKAAALRGPLGSLKYLLYTARKQSFFGVTRYVWPESISFVIPSLSISSFPLWCNCKATRLLVVTSLSHAHALWHPHIIFWSGRSWEDIRQYVDMMTVLI
jgi:hypothetical protein